MTLEIDEPVFARRIANKDGVLHFNPKQGMCDGVELNKPVHAKRVANKEGVLHYLMSDQKLEPDGKMKIGKPYFGKRVEQKDGVLHYRVKGKKCVAGDPTVCGCVICCTLSATVQLGNGVAGDPWGDPVDVALTCGGVIEFEISYSCLNDEIEDDQFNVPYTQTFAEKNTPSLRTKIWSSEEFEYDEGTYKLHYFRSEVGEDDPSCYEGWLLQKWITEGIEFDPRGEHWDVVDSYWNGGVNVYGYWVAATLAEIFEFSDDNPYLPEDDCPPGYSYNGGDAGVGYGCATYPPPSGTFGGRSDYSFSECPVVLLSESWYSSFVTPTEEQKVKCAKVSIYDLCDEEE